jgi:hypothetical protein
MEDEVKLLLTSFPLFIYHFTFSWTDQLIDLIKCAK